MKRLLTVRETAEYLGLSAQTIYNATAKNSAKPLPFKPIRVRSKPVFDIRDLDEYIETQKAEAGRASK